MSLNKKRSPMALAMTALAMTAGLSFAACTKTEPANPDSAAMANPATAPAQPAPVAPVQQGSETAGVTAGTTSPSADGPKGSVEGSSDATSPGTAVVTPKTAEPTPVSKMNSGKK